MTIIGTPPTSTAEQADDLLHAAMRDGRVPFDSALRALRVPRKPVHGVPTGYRYLLLPPRGQVAVLRGPALPGEAV